MVNMQLFDGTDHFDCRLENSGLEVRNGQWQECVMLQEGTKTQDYSSF